MQSNKLIFGKDNTKNIVNITLKNNEVYLYSETKEGVQLEKFPYTPWALSSKPISEISEQLKGNQYYRYITSLDTIKFQELNQRFQRDMWLPRSIEECFTLCEGATYYKGMKVDDVSILSFDIETSGLVMNNTSQVYIISNTLRKNGQIIRKLFSLDDYSNDPCGQENMILDWCKWVRAVDPSILCGHNILSYDFPYIRHVYSINAPDDSLPLGRDGSDAEFAEKTSRFRKDGSQQYDYHNVRITGREIIDTFFLSIKYDIPRDFPSYGLKPIIKYLGLEKIDRTFIDAAQIRHQWNDLEMREKIKQYAIEDSDDALKLYDLMIPAYFYLAQSIPKTMQQMVNEAAGSQLDALMIRSYLQDGYSQPKTSMKVPFEGAISMGIPGVYDNVCKADVAALYPSIMLEYNIHNAKKDPFNNMIQILSYFRDERLRNKKLAKETGEQYYKDLDQSQKIVINSLYGFLGAGFLLYNYPEGGAEVTRKGREMLLKGVEWATGYTLERVIKNIANEGTEDEETSYEWKLGQRKSDGRGYTLANVDTDSFSITANRPISKEEFAKELKELNTLYPELIKWEDDGQYEKVIVIRAKNYVLVRDGKVKFKGSAMTDQKKEPALTEMLEKMIYALLDDERAALPTIYRSYIREALDIQFINRWTTKKTITKAVLKPNRLTEQKILDAMNECIKKGIVENFQEGDKLWLYNSIDGMIQASAKGKLTFYKNGEPKLVPNHILKDVRLWNHDEDKLHYLGRIYATVQILENVIQIDQFVDYTLKTNREQLKSLDKSVNL
jgi:DNA polymerase elongation subunit (family B)